MIRLLLVCLLVPLFSAISEPVPRGSRPVVPPNADKPVPFPPIPKKKVVPPPLVDAKGFPNLGNLEFERNWEIIRALARLRGHKRYSQHTLQVTTGELNAVIKLVLGIPPHAFAHPVRLQFVPLRTGGVQIVFFDGTRPRQGLGYLAMSGKGKVTHFRITQQREVDRMIQNAPNHLKRLVAGKNADPNLLRIAALGQLLYSDRGNALNLKVVGNRTYLSNYSNAMLEGEFEYMVKLFFKVPNRNPPLITDLIPRRNVVSGRRIVRQGHWTLFKNRNHNSTLIAFVDASNGQRIGMIGLHYDPPPRGNNRVVTPIRFVNFQPGNQSNARDLLNNVWQLQQQGLFK